MIIYSVYICNCETRWHMFLSYLIVFEILNKWFFSYLWVVNLVRVSESLIYIYLKLVVFFTSSAPLIKPLGCILPHHLLSFKGPSVFLTCEVVCFVSFSCVDNLKSYLHYLHHLEYLIFFSSLECCLRSEAVKQIKLWRSMHKKHFFRAQNTDVATTEYINCLKFLSRMCPLGL